MDVILQQNFASLGFLGDRVAVKRGYARNYLLPRGIAVEASSSNARQLKHRLNGINAKRLRMKGEAEKLGEQLKAVPLEFTLKLGGQGKSFGAVTSKDIELVLKQAGFELDRRQIRLAEAIKSGGHFEVHVRLHSEVTISLPVTVKAEVAAAAVEADLDEAGAKRERRKGGRGRKAKAEGEAETAPEESKDAE
jgi:large subunit ribosomal protein L9